MKLDKPEQAQANETEDPVTLTTPTSPADKLAAPESPEAATRPRARIADQLVALVLERYRLVRSTKNEPLAIAREGAGNARRLHAGQCSLKADIARLYHQRYGRVPSGGALSDAMRVLIGEAMEASPVELHLRVANHDGSIVLDLADDRGSVVVISADGWRVTTDSPVIFRRTELTAPLPAPERGGELAELRSVLNVTDTTWPLVVGHLVAALIPDISHPAVLIGGEQGAGKSTAAKLLGRIIDPSRAELRTPPLGLEDWGVSISASWVVPIDNVSRIQDWWSDAICRAVTGDGVVRRQRYTDTGVSVLSHRRVIMLTSIDPGALKSDLGERLLLLDFLPIGAEERECEADLMARFQDAHPRILGALLDLTVRVLAERTRVETQQLMRMADFHRVLVALDQVEGIGAADRYMAQPERVALEVVESDTVGCALRAWISEVREWEGTSTELLDILRPDPVGPDWPRTPGHLSRRLGLQVPALRQLGIEVTSKRTSDSSRTRLLRIRYASPSRSAPLVAQPQDAEPNARTGAPRAIRTNRAGDEHLRRSDAPDGSDAHEARVAMEGPVRAEGPGVLVGSECPEAVPEPVPAGAGEGQP